MDLKICHTRLITFIVCWLELITVLTGLTLTAFPSSDVEVDQVVSLQCLLEQETYPLIIVAYKLDTVTLCTLEPNNGTCKNGCQSYNVSCPSKTKYNLQVSVPFSWNGKSLTCNVLTNVSNPVQLSVKVPVKTVAMKTPTSHVLAGEQINLTCTTSECYPPANISWNMSMADITYQSSFKINASGSGGLVRTTSFLRIQATKLNNGKQVFCTASNIPSQKVVSKTYSLNVYYKPEVNSITPNPYNITEGNDATLVCIITDANPSNGIIWKWFNATSSNPKILHDGSNYTITDIVRTSTGLYGCTASNDAGPSEKVTIFVDVHYKPDVTTNTSNPYKVIEGQDATLTCLLNAANPKSDIRWKWFKAENSSITLYNGPSYAIPIIQRGMSGSYICTASNSAGTSENLQIQIDVQYPPKVNVLSHHDIVEGGNLSVTCQVTHGNPSSTSIFWSKEGTAGFKLERPTLQLPNIQRNSSGTYRCIAENTYSNEEKGTDSQTMVVNVQYQPTIGILEKRYVNESNKVTLTGNVTSNPLANVLWFYGTKMLKNQTSVSTATFTIENATCTDTKNFTVEASNGIGQTVKRLVELYVNCKPRSFKTNFTLGVTDTTGIDFSTIIIAYPEPSIRLEYENGTKSEQMMESINKNAVNNFTIQISQAVVNQSDFGIYHLIVWNSFGKITVNLNVIPRRKPNAPGNIEIVCEETRAKVQWRSSFNGGDPQLFTVIVSNGQQSDNISDTGENVVHSTFVQHLQSSTMYVFYVSAQNSHGFISSEKISCTTLAESSEKLPIIVGSAAAGGITLVAVVFVVFLFRRFTNTEKQAGKSQRFENDLDEKESVDDDGLKDNILYVSADPRENEKHEAAVYAPVNKKDPMSNNNSNVYAEVKKTGIKDVKEGAIYSDVKPKKGFFKKDGKVKKERRQKRKKEVADVYENSDDIAMTANSDNVYSNTNHKNDSAKEQRGYKNKDGLLYVEVQFDTKTEDKNPVIHGDDEKTDYATVEFPVPSSSHDRE